MNDLEKIEKILEVLENTEEMAKLYRQKENFLANHIDTETRTSTEKQELALRKQFPEFNEICLQIVENRKIVELHRFQLDCLRLKHSMTDKDLSLVEG